MWELFKESILPINVLYTILLGLTLFYWLTVFLAGLDIDLIDIDIDADVDIDVDIDADIDADVDASGNGSGFSLGKLLHFFNIGDVPFMIILSFLSLFMWAGSILFNHYTNNQSALIGLAIFFPLFIISLFLTKLCSAPFVKLFAAFDKQADRSVVGMVCTVKVGTSEGSLGQADVDTEDFHQLINIKAVPNLRLNKGDLALILEYNEEGNYYIVDESNQ